MPSDDNKNLAQALRRVDPTVWKRINSVLNAHKGNLRSLAKLAGLNPKRDFRGISLAGLTLANQDLKGFDFSGSDLRGCEIRNARVDGTTIFDNAELDPLDRACVASLSESIHYRRERQKMPNEDRTQTEELSDFQRLALSALIRFDLIVRERQGNPVTQAQLGLDAGLGKLVDATDERAKRTEVGAIVGDFLNKAGRRGSLELKQYYEKLLRQSARSFQNLPPHITTAIGMLYEREQVLSPDAIRIAVPGEQPSQQSEDESNEYALSDVFSKVRYKEPGRRELLGLNYGGIWDVVRYSAHMLVAHDHPPDNDPWVVRAALQIGPIDLVRGRKEPWFEIHYRPREEPCRKSTGSVILINNGQHFALIGREHDVDAPIYVVAEFLRVKQDYFRGLVVRRHSTGRFFTSRCAFVRSKAKTMEDLADKINVYRESELRKKFSDDILNLDWCLKDAVNTIANESRSVLLLR